MSLVAINLLISASSINAAPVLYSNSTDFLNALGGAAVTSQHFDSFSHGSDLKGSAVLPGIRVNTNLGELIAWDPLCCADRDVNIFGKTRSDAGGAYYDILFTNSYNAFAFDIENYNPDATVNDQHGVLDVNTTLGSFMFDITQTGALESAPIFIGLITEGDLLSIRWNEGPEISGIGNEETTLDNFMVASVSPVPAPAAVWLFGTALVGLIGFGKRRKAA